MFLSNLKLWNFRKFGSETGVDLKSPNLNLNFSKGLNVLIGENDSGKSTIMDAIKLVLKTHSYEWIRVTDEDFYNNATRLRIELRFDDFTDDEAKHFTEWLGWEGEGDAAMPFLKLIYEVTRTNERILPSDVKAGVDEEGISLSAEAREYLKITYLKPLRDAHSELVPKRNSRLSQIFQEHDAFKDQDKEHHLVKIFGKFNASIVQYFEGKDADDQLIDDQRGKKLKESIDQFIHSFYSQTNDTEITVAEGNIKKILETLELSLRNEKNPGLGTLNRLFMASELVHLGKPSWDGLRLGLIEELEAHLHPQAQMQIIETLQKLKDIQLILTTHSPNLASKVKLENLIICNNSTAFPMGSSNYTKLAPDDYLFLERFLDVTKANLFFAKGIIMVEGWAEEILLPALARKMKSSQIISRDLTEAGVSIVNVGNTAFLRYSRIFLRKEEPAMNIPVAIITDVDVREYEKAGDDYVKRDDRVITEETIAQIEKKESEFNDQVVKAFIAPHWTLEYCVFKSSSLSAKFQEVAKSIHEKTDFGDFEKELAAKLINKGLKKTEIAYQIAQIIDSDAQKEIVYRQAQEANDRDLENFPSPEVTLIQDDEAIKYLIEAIKYACGN